MIALAKRPLFAQSPLNSDDSHGDEESDYAADDQFSENFSSGEDGKRCSRLSARSASDVSLETWRGTVQYG